MFRFRKFQITLPLSKMSNFYRLPNISPELSGTVVAYQESGNSLGYTPLYQQVATWLLMLPLLNMFAKGSLSFLSPPATAFYYQNAHLLRTAQGIRLPVVINVLLL